MSCFREEFPENENLRLTWKVYEETNREEGPANRKMLVKFFNPIGELVETFNAREWKNSGTSDIVAERAGEYKVCFEDIWMLSEEEPTVIGPRLVDFTLEHGVETIDYQAVARREHLKPLELELRRIEDLTEELIKDYEYMREREHAMRRTSESTFERINYLSVFSILVLSLSAFFQMRYLRTFFRHKKLL